MEIRENIEISEWVEELNKEFKKNQEVVLKELGNVLVSSLKNNIKRSNKNQDGYIHIKDDVRKKIIIDKNTGNKVLMVSGSKRTGSKWHLLNDGTYKTKATHFIDKSLSELDSKANAIIDTYLG